MMPRDLMNRLRMLIAEMVVEAVEERTRATWRSFGMFWKRSPSVAVSSLPHAPEPRQPKETA